uniref:Uncharacterized protein n=1 Tax=Anguilla anguilla TaxID=7936 RepID=A0A0E9QF12_ANGAN
MNSVHIFHHSVYLVTVQFGKLTIFYQVLY